MSVQTKPTESMEIRKRLKHPIVDGDGHLHAWFFVRDAAPRQPDGSLGDAYRAARIDELLHPPQQLAQVVVDLVRLGRRGFVGIAGRVVHRARVCRARPRGARPRQGRLMADVSITGVI